MSKFFKFNLLCFVLFYISTGIAFSQISEKEKLKKYRENPVWISMMKDSSTNYFEAVQAFDEFWKDRKAPVEDEEEGDKEHEEKEWTKLRKFLHKKEYKKEKEGEQYRLEHKMFKHWKMTMEPYVQPDGRILTSDEQLEIWKSQRQ